MLNDTSSFVKVILVRKGRTVVSSLLFHVRKDLISCRQPERDVGRGVEVSLVDR